VIPEVLFIQGAGEGAYDEDKLLVASLRQALGEEYEVHYPAMPDECEAAYGELSGKIEQEVSRLTEPLILVGHSVGGSTLMKWLSEGPIDRAVDAICLIAAPFWGGEGWRYEGYEELELPEDMAARLPEGARVLLFHCRDDEIVPFGHLELYARLVPEATVRALNKGGHQLSNDLSAVAASIKSRA
jgi:predicted alpha/beta hydrolase family esterase